jgi:hypothetical protein
MAFLPLAARNTDKFVQSVTRRTLCAITYAQ